MIFSAFLLLLSSISASAQTAPSEMKSWPENFFQAVANSTDEARFRFANALFDGGTEFDLFNESFNGKFPTSVNIRRDVYNNYDLLNSWTVIDRIRLRVEPVLFSRHIDKEKNSFWDKTAVPDAAFGIGVNGTLEIRKFQQISPKGVNTQEKPANPDPGSSDIQELNPYLSANALDSSLRVKLHRVLAPFKLPFELPLSRKAVRRMEVGDVISYNLSGKFGFTVPLSLTEIPGFLNFHSGPAINLGWHWNGQFQVSVMKESERYAKVRFGKLRGHGHVFGFSVAASTPDIYPGFYLFKGKKYEIHAGQISLMIEPFKYQITKQSDVEFDAGFRYDLDSEEGREAYHRAVLGQREYSEKIADEQVDLPHPAVTQLYTRKTSRTTRSSAIGTNLSVIFSASRTRSTDEVETTIELPESTRHLLRSASEERQNLRSINGNDEKTSHRISILMDEDGFAKKIPNSLLLIAENTVEDSSTNAEEMNKYTDEISSVLEESNLFPVFPDIMPKRNHPDQFKKAWYGRSSFYYGYTLNEVTLGQFFKVDPLVLERAGIQNGILIDKDLFKEAGEAFEEHDSKRLHELLTLLYSDRKHSLELMQTTVQALNSGDYEKFLVAQNPALGNIQKRGHKISSMETDYTNTEQEMGLGSDTVRTVADPDAVINKLDTRLNSDGLVELRFTLAKTPEFMYFLLAPLNHRHKNKDTVEFSFYNRDSRFKEGENLIVLDPASSDPLIQTMTKKLDSNEFVLLTLGYSQKGSNWGYGASTRFFTSIKYEKPSKDKKHIFNFRRSN